MKRYHENVELPARQALAEWNIMRSVFLPMLLEYQQESTLVYEMAKVFVFMSSAPNPRKITNMVVHRNSIRSFVAATLDAPHMVSALLRLLAPALDVDNVNKSERDLMAVDLVVTVLKQMLEAANGSSGRYNGTSCGIQTYKR